MPNPTGTVWKPIIRPFEVLTTYAHSGVANKFLGRYIVIATSASHAVQSLELENGEEILEAKELKDHKLVIGK